MHYSCTTSADIFRCFLFTGSIELAWHNNLYRAYNLPSKVAAEEVCSSSSISKSSKTNDYLDSLREN
jgi:hypothetical protein